MTLGFHLEFCCSNCGEVLEVEEDMDAFWHREYHSCFGERFGIVATASQNTISANDGIDINLTQQAEG